MRCALCVIVKKENDYLREFVEYHLSVGYDTIFICDNNDPSVELARDVVADYVESKSVVIIPTPSHRYAQRRAYTNCYNNHAQDYDWMSFVDADEFITLKRHKSIKEFLAEPCFDGYNVIQLNWMCYGDSEQLQRIDSKGVLERLTEPIIPLNGRENKFIKSTIRGKAQHPVKFRSAHYPTAECGRVCDSHGRERAVNSIMCSEPQFEVAYIRHYVTKTLEEYIVNKIGRKGSGNRSSRDAKCRLTLKYFWMRNKKTPEKVAFAKQIMGFWGYYTCRYYQFEGDVRNFIYKNKHKYIYPILIKAKLIRR